MAPGSPLQKERKIESKKTGVSAYPRHVEGVGAGTVSLLLSSNMH